MPTGTSARPACCCRTACEDTAHHRIHAYETSESVVVCTDRPQPVVCSSDQIVSVALLLMTLSCHSGLNLMFRIHASTRLVQLSNGSSGSSTQQQGAAQGAGLNQVTEDWQTGRMCNLEYLLHMNWVVGRRPGDRTFSPQLPWVLDMTSPPEDAADSGQVRNQFPAFAPKAPRLHIRT